MTDECATPTAEDPNFEWELCVEDIRPLKQGRRLAELNKALTHTHDASTPAKPAAEMVEDKFTELMASAVSSEDPLMFCLRFIRWFDATFPVGNQKLFYQYLWKFVNKFASLPMYLDDDRMLRVWMKLAENSLGNAIQIYQHANTIGSLLRCASLYVEWCWVCEGGGNVGEARRVLARARAAAALPLEMIIQAEDDLEMREMRREQLRAAASHDDSWEEDEEGRRIALTRIEGIRLGPSSDAVVAPIVRLPEIVGERSNTSHFRTPGPTNRTRNFKTPGTSFKTPGISLKTPGFKTPGFQQTNEQFEIFEDDEETAATNVLENVYEMDGHIQHINIVENLRPSCAITATPRSTTRLAPVSGTFEIWDEEKENEGGKGEKKAAKARLCLRKELVREMSIEESLAARYSVMTEETPMREFSKPRVLLLSKNDARKIDFDAD